MRGGEWYLEKRGSRKILAGFRNLGSVFDKSRSLVFAWFVFTFFESRNFLPKSLGLGFLTRISASRRVSDFTIRHPYYDGTNWWNQEMPSWSTNQPIGDEKSATWHKFPIQSFYYPWFYWFSRRNRRQPLCHLKIMHRNWIMQVLFHAVFIIHTIEDNFSSWFRFTDSWRVIYNGTIKPLQLVIHVDMGSWRGIKPPCWPTIWNYE